MSEKFSDVCLFYVFHLFALPKIPHDSLDHWLYAVREFHGFTQIKAEMDQQNFFQNSRLYLLNYIDSQVLLFLFVTLTFLLVSIQNVF